MRWNIVKMLWKSVLLLLAGIVIGTILLVLAYMLPVNSQNESVYSELLEKEGWYPRASVTARSMDTYFNSFLPDVLDNSTDALMLNTALDTSAGSALARAMNVHSENILGDYTYYWHGYVVILRPLMFLFDFTEVRILNSICQLFLLFALAFKIGREKGLGYILMLATSYVLLSSLAMPLSLQFTWVFYIAYLGTLILLQKQEFFSAWHHYVYFFIGIGMLTSYFDLLTYPLFTWGVPLVWWLVMDKSQEREWFWVKRVVSSGFSWIAGYAVMWVAKWGIATIVLGRNIFESAMNEVFFRSGILEDNVNVFQDRLQAIYINWKHYGYIPYFLLLAGWLLWWIYCTIKNGWYGSTKRYAYFLVGTSSVVWFLVLTNHTLGHHFFTHRIYGVSILAFLALMLESVCGKTGDVAFVRRKRLAVCYALGFAGGISLMLTQLAREELSVLNGGASFQNVEVTGGVEMDFSPDADVIKRLNLGLSCEGVEGQYEIILWEGDIPKYQENILIADCEGNYQSLEVSWKLNRHKTYRLTVEIQGNDEVVYAWVTDQGEMPLVECTDLTLDGAAMQGQLLLGITYWCPPVSKKMVLFLYMTWVGILLAGVYTFIPHKYLIGRNHERRL